MEHGFAGSVAESYGACAIAFGEIRSKFARQQHYVITSVTQRRGESDDAVGIGIHAPYDTGKSGYYNMQSFGKSLAFHLAIGYPF